MASKRNWKWFGHAGTLFAQGGVSFTFVRWLENISFPLLASIGRSVVIEKSMPRSTTRNGYKRISTERAMTSTLST